LGELRAVRSSGSRRNPAAKRNQLAAETARAWALVNPALKVPNDMQGLPPTNARSHQTIHYGAPSRPLRH
jgi:hypothetical protein